MDGFSVPGSLHASPKDAAGKLVKTHEGVEKPKSLQSKASAEGKDAAVAANLEPEDSQNWTLPQLKETTGGEFRVYRTSIRLL